MCVAGDTLGADARIICRESAHTCIHPQLDIKFMGASQVSVRERDTICVASASEFSPRENKEAAHFPDV